MFSTSASRPATRWAFSAPPRIARRAAGLYAFAPATVAMASKTTAFSFQATSIDGDEVPLSKYAGKVCLVVNVASGLTAQNYKELAVLYSRQVPPISTARHRLALLSPLSTVNAACTAITAALQGLEILAFPCNQFGGQEPKSNAEIKAFAQARGAEYPLFAKVDVNGPNAHPLYKWMKAETLAAFGLIEVPVKWNFEKFTISRDGLVAERYLPTTSPLAMEQDIRKLL